MNRLPFTTRLPFLVGMLACLLMTSHYGIAQDAPSIFTGRVVDEAGAPVAGLTVALMPVKDGPGGWFTMPVHQDSHWADAPRAFAAVTDAEGHFSIIDFEPGPVLFGLLPRYLYHPPADVLYLDMNGFVLYATEQGRARGIVFVTEPGERIEDVEVTVRRALQIQGKVLRMDGNPLVNADIKLNLQSLSLGDGSGRSTGWRIPTDATGEFVQHAPRHITNAPVYYTVSATFQGQRAAAKPVVLKQPALSLSPVLKFTVPLIPALSRISPRQYRAGASVYSGIDAQGVWIVNPGNGHAYKKIQCRGPEDAIFQASEEGAYLVSINDEAEQRWLERVFSPQMTLIGLNDVEKEGEWRWHSGEPVTYTNWAPHEPHDTDSGDEDYVIWHGGWQDIGPNQILWQFLSAALIEKEGKQ